MMWFKLLWSKNFLRNSSTILEDHKITNYIDKLRTHGLNRNQSSTEKIEAEAEPKPLRQQSPNIPLAQKNISESSTTDTH